uniref:Protein FAM227B n=1 Tax=Castor canadensis TaxID=51338 RepID=A0A8C0X3Q0_CASCN
MGKSLRKIGRDTQCEQCKKSAYMGKEELPSFFYNFLQDYWPRDVNLVDNEIWIYNLKKVKEDSSFISVYSYLWESVPRIFEAGVTMESRLKECSLLLHDHASKLFEWDRMISKKSSYEKLEAYKTFLKKHRKENKIMVYIYGCKFSGFKAYELTQLPRHLDAKRIYLFILKTHNFEEKVFKIWKSHFLSDASIALLHDSFWWWFLYKFKPDRKFQDCLFDRISESYVALFLSIPISRKDAFFQVYPDCLAQAIYATFQEAFPESSNLFNDEFKEDLGNTIILWLSGMNISFKGFWSHWKLKELSTTTIHGSRKAPAKSLKERITSSQERIAESKYLPNWQDGRGDQKQVYPLSDWCNSHSLVKVLIALDLVFVVTVVCAYYGLFLCACRTFLY